MENEIMNDISKWVNNPEKFLNEYANLFANETGIHKLWLGNPYMGKSTLKNLLIKTFPNSNIKFITFNSLSGYCNLNVDMSENVIIITNLMNFTINNKPVYEYFPTSDNILFFKTRFISGIGIYDLLKNKEGYHEANPFFYQKFENVEYIDAFKKLLNNYE